MDGVDDVRLHSVAHRVVAEPVLAAVYPTYPYQPAAVSSQVTFAAPGEVDGVDVVAWQTMTVLRVVLYESGTDVRHGAECTGEGEYAFVRAHPQVAFVVRREGAHLRAAFHGIVHPFVAVVDETQCPVPLIHQVQSATHGSHPHMTLPVLMDVVHIVHAKAVEVIATVFILGKPVLCRSANAFTHKDTPAFGTYPIAAFAVFHHAVRGSYGIRRLQFVVQVIRLERTAARAHPQEAVGKENRP